MKPNPLGMLLSMAALGVGVGLPLGPERVARDPSITPLVNATDKQRRAAEKAERRRLRNLKIAGGP